MTKWREYLRLRGVELISRQKPFVGRNAKTAYKVEQTK